MGQSTVGLDFGLKTFLTLSDGTSVQSPQFLRSALNELAKANRRLSRRVKYSPGWWKAHRMLDKVHERITNLRRDWFFKLAHKLTDAYDFIFLEDLNLRGMKKLWGRKVSDLAFATFLDILKHVAQAKGVVVQQVHRFYPSSKTCSCCGHIHQELTVEDRRWRCPGCGAVNDRDHNAAVNIEREGASSLGLVPVGPLLGVGR
jgi:putative transposase